MNTNRYQQALVGSATIVLSLLACRPVFAIGWTELLILLIIIAFLFGPYLLKLYRTIDKLKKANKEQEKKK